MPESHIERPSEVDIVSHEIQYVSFDGKLVAAHDVTDRLRSQDALRDSEAKYRLLFEESSEAYWLLSCDGYVDCNTAAPKLFGFEHRAEFTHPAEVSPPNQADGTPSRMAADAKIASALSSGCENFEWLHRRRNGELFPAEVRLSALKLSGRDLLLATVRDITERRRSEEALSFQAALLQAQSETTLDGILAVNENHRLLLANHQFGLHFGIPPEVLEAKDDIAVCGFIAQQLENPEEFVRTVDDSITGKMRPRRLITPRSCGRNKGLR